MIYVTRCEKPTSIFYRELVQIGCEDEVWLDRLP